MRFEDFIREGQVRRGKKDANLAKSLFLKTMKDRDFFDELEINENSARKLVSNYFDFLRSILEAMAALDGYKIYNHEAFTYYLKEKKEDAAAIKFDRFRQIRNGINYRGSDIDVNEAKEIIDSIKDVMGYLIDKYLARMR